MTHSINDSDILLNIWKIILHFYQMKKKEKCTGQNKQTQQIYDDRQFDAVYVRAHLAQTFHCTVFCVIEHARIWTFYLYTWTKQIVLLKLSATDSRKWYEKTQTIFSFVFDKPILLVVSVLTYNYFYVQSMYRMYAFFELIHLICFKMKRIFSKSIAEFSLEISCKM